MPRSPLSLPLALVLLLAWAAPAGAQQTSENTPRLKQALEQYPEADANKDGVLTRAEATRHIRTLRGGGIRALAAGAALLDTEVFRVTAEELDRLMQAENIKTAREPLQFPKTDGRRVLMTGHSWVGPAVRTLPEIAAAAGIQGHHQRVNSSGGGTGSANSRWRAEIGRFDGSPPRPILFPAIATGQWDVMTWGAFHNDTPEHFTQWIDICLKHNPEMLFYIQDGWPLYRDELARLAPEEAIASIRSQQQAINRQMQTTVAALDRRYPGKVRIIPAGDAVSALVCLQLEGKLPGLDSVSEHLGGQRGVFKDGGHLSRDSGMDYVAGYVYFATLYGRSPEQIEGFTPKGVSSELDRIFRRVAWQSVVDHPLSGVKDADGDGRGDESPAARP